VLPDWFYSSVIDRSLVLTIDPAYFRLTGGIERWLYRVARKHAGRQWHGWVFEFAHLHAKSGSLARVSDFALDIRRIAVRQRLPGYRLLIERKGRSELLRILPVDPSTVPVNNPVNRLGRSGARVSADRAQTVSADQAHASQLNLWPARQSRAANLESNRESNSSALAHAHEGRCRCARFRELVRGFAKRLQDSRTGFTNRELQYATKAHFYGLFGQAVPDTRTSIFRPGQFANSAHSEASTQTRNLHACVNPLQRLGSSPLPIHETWRTDSRCRGARFREPAPSFVDSCRVSRTGFTNLEPQYLEKPSILGLSGRATSDALTAICGTAQYTNSAHSRVSTQTRNQHRSGNPLQRLAFASAPIRESRNTDSRGAGAELRGPVRNTVDSHPISTIEFAEEPAQDTSDVDHGENSKRSKR